MKFEEYQNNLIAFKLETGHYQFFAIVRAKHLYKTKQYLQAKSMQMKFEHCKSLAIFSGDEIIKEAIKTKVGLSLKQFNEVKKLIPTL